MMNGAGLLWSEIRYYEQEGIADGHVATLRAVEFERSPILSGYSFRTQFCIKL